MSRATSQSTHSFVEYLDAHGQDLSKSLSGHFDGLQVFLDGQKEGVLEVRGASKCFEKHNIDCVVPIDESLPSQRTFPAISSLPRTREHSAIRSEARAALSHSDVGSKQMEEAASLNSMTDEINDENENPQPLLKRSSHRSIAAE